MSDTEEGPAGAASEPHVGDRWRGVKIAAIYNLDHGKLFVSQGSVVNFEVCVGGIFNRIEQNLRRVCSRLFQTASIATTSCLFRIHHPRSHLASASPASGRV